jgi:Predicted transcription factor, homolog of eukaryotic MBF1
MSTWREWEDLKRELLEDAEFRTAVQELEPEHELVRSLIACRQNKGLSQAALAAMIGTRQSAISRLESGTYNPSVKFLKKLARALDADLVISLRPRPRASQ